MDTRAPQDSIGRSSRAGESAEREVAASSPGKSSPRRNTYHTVFVVALVVVSVGVCVRLIGFPKLLIHDCRTNIAFDLRSICEAARQYRALTGAYPETLEEMVNPTDEAGNELPGLEKYPRDPWGNDYIYGLRDGKPFARCLGKDQRPGGTGDDADYEEPEPENQG